MSYKDIYGSIASQRSNLRSYSSNISSARKNINIAKQNIRSRNLEIKKQRYRSSKSSISNQRTRRVLKKQKQTIADYEKQLSNAEAEISSAYPKLSEYEKKVKEYESKGYQVREADGNLEFFTTKTIKKTVQPRKVSMVVKYRKAGSNKVRSASAYNTNLNSVVSGLERSGYVIEEIVALGNLDKGSSSRGVVYTRETVQDSVPTVDISSSKKESFPSIEGMVFNNPLKTNTPFVPNAVIESRPSTVQQMTGTKTGMDEDLPVSPKYYQKRSVTNISPDVALGSAKKYQKDRYPSVTVDTSKGKPVSLEDIKERFTFTENQITESKNIIQSNISKIDIDLQTVQNAEYGVFYFDMDKGKTEMGRGDAYKFLKTEKGKQQQSYKQLEEAEDELLTAKSKTVNLSRGLYSKGYRPYEKDGELVWYKEEPSDVAMAKAERITGKLGGKEFAEFWSSGVLSARDPLRLKSLIGLGTGLLSKKDVTRDVAFDVERLDTAKNEGAISYLSTAYTSPFAVTGFSVAMGYGFGNLSGTVAGRLAYSSPTLAKGFMVGEMAIGTAYLTGEAIQVGEAFKKSPSEGLTALTTTGMRVGGGFYGYKLGRDIGFARGTRWGYRSEVKKGDLILYDAGKQQEFILESGTGKDYRNLLLQREKSLWKLEKQGLFKVKTEAKNPVNLENVQTMSSQKSGFKKFTPKFMQKYKSELFGSASEKTQFIKIPKGESHDLDIGFKRYVRASDMWDYSTAKFKIKDQVADIKPLPKTNELVTPFGGRKQPSIKGYEINIGGKTYHSNYRLMPLRESGLRHAHSSLDLAHKGRIKDIGRTTDIATELYTQGVKTGQIGSFKAWRMKKNLDFLIETNPTYESYPKIMDPARAEMFYTTDPLPTKRDIPDIIYKKITPSKIQTKVNQYTFGKIKGIKLSSGKGSKNVPSTPPSVSQEYASFGKTPSLTIASSVGKKTNAGKKLWGSSESIKSPSISPSPSRSLSYSFSPSPSPSRSISPSISSVTSPSISKSIIRSKSVSPSPSISISPSPSPSPSISPSISPSPSPSPSISPSISPSPSPSPSPSSSPSQVPKSFSYSSLSLSGRYKQKAKSKSDIGIQIPKKSYGKTLYSDLLSVTVSQARYGKATHPFVTGKLWKESKKKLYLDVPTVELSPRSERKGFGYRSVKWI